MKSDGSMAQPHGPQSLSIYMRLSQFIVQPSKPLFYRCNRGGNWVGEWGIDTPSELRRTEHLLFWKKKIADFGKLVR